MPLGQPYDPGRPATLADHYDPVKVEAQHEAVMDKILSLKRELETKTGLAAFMGIAPQYKDPSTGQINIAAALSSDQGKQWSTKYPELAFNAMEKAGLMGGGKAQEFEQVIKLDDQKAQELTTKWPQLKPGYSGPGAYKMVTVNGVPSKFEAVKDVTKEKEVENDFNVFYRGYKKDNPNASESDISKAWHKQKIDENKAIADAKTGDIQSQAKDIAEEIMAGRQSPVLQGRNVKLSGAIQSYLAKNHYNLRAAQLDYQATMQHVKTLNGPQQTRLRQATQFAYDSLPLVEKLAKDWNGGNFPIMNKANLMAAKSGAYGAKAQDIATKLISEINDIQSELGVVYMGGNAPTEMSLKNAAEMLKADWSYHSILANTDLIRTNLSIRLNSINATGVAGLSDSAAETPKKEEPSKQTEGVTPSGYKFKVIP